MIRPTPLTLVLAAVLASGSAVRAQAPSRAFVTVRLDEATRARLGIATQALAAAAEERREECLARVLDPASLATLDGEIAAALSAAELSRSEAERSEALFTDGRVIPAQARDAARAQQRADEIRVEDARRRLRLAWGECIGGLADDARRRLVESALAGSVALVRIELPPGVAIPAPSAPIALESPSLPAPVSAAWTSRALCSLPAADADLQTSALLARADGADASGHRLVAGLALTARVPSGGAVERGVTLPRSALLRREGTLWAWVERSPREFERRRVDGGRPVADGWFVATGFTVGEAVVTAGAADLLAAERATAPQPASADTDDD